MVWITIGTDALPKVREAFQSQGLVLPAYEERYLDGIRIGHFRSLLLLVDPKLELDMFRRPTVIAGNRPAT